MSDAGPAATRRSDAEPVGASPSAEATQSIRIDWAAVALVALGVAIRAIYLLEYASLPFLDGPSYDSDVYLRQAVAVRAGDFGHPTLVAFSPLYGYWLAALGAPADLVVPVVAQLLLGAASGWLVLAVGRALFDRRSGLVALALWSGYALLPFHESKIMAEALGMALVLLAYWAFVHPRFVQGRLAFAVAAGAVLGLAVLARANLVLTAPFMVIAALLPWRVPCEADEPAAPPRPGPHRTDEPIRGKGYWSHARRRAIRAGGLALGLSIVLLAHGVWTWVHTGFFVPVIMVSQTAARATQRDSSGTLEDMGGGRDDAGSPWSVVRQAEERIARRRAGQPEAASAGGSVDLVGAILGAPPKIWRTLADTEISFFDYGYYGERTEVTTLRVLPVTWGMLEILAVVGAVLIARRRSVRGLVPLLAPVVGVLATAVLFHPSSRYRVVMVLPLLWASGYGIAHLGDIPARAVRAVVIGLLAAASLWLAQRTVRYELDHPGVWELRVAEAWLRRRDGLTPYAVDAARARVRRAREIGGDDPRVRDRVTYLQSLVPHVPLTEPPPAR